MSLSPLSVEERAKYEEIWSFPEYRGDHVSAHAARAVSLMPMTPGESIIDFGAGHGYASDHLRDAGFRVLAVDIAVNAMAPEVAARIPRLIGNLWELPIDISGDWGFCCDMMEHIPPAHVRDVLACIRRSTRRETYFNIALHPDKCGGLIGKPLHLTVESADWWRAILAEFWQDQTTVDSVEGMSLSIIVR
jgi:hypothetical protein